MTLNALLGSFSLMCTSITLAVSGPGYFRTTIQGDVSGISCNTTVFVGSSRMKSGIDIETWEKQMNNDATKLVIVNSSPRGVLDQLADDNKFIGRVVIEVNEHLFYSMHTTLCEETAMTALHITEKEKRELFEELKITVRKIRSRGGNVIFVRLPSSGSILAWENKDYPLADYWYRLLENTGAPGFHFMDYRETASLTCSDGSHLSPADAVIYTKHLATMLRNEKGFDEY